MAHLHGPRLAQPCAVSWCARPRGEGCNSVSQQPVLWTDHVLPRRLVATLLALQELLQRALGALDYSAGGTHVAISARGCGREEAVQVWSMGEMKGQHAQQQCCADELAESPRRGRTASIGTRVRCRLTWAEPSMSGKALRKHRRFTSSWCGATSKCTQWAVRTYIGILAAPVSCIRKKGACSSGRSSQHEKALAEAQSAAGLLAHPEGHFSRSTTLVDANLQHHLPPTSATQPHQEQLTGQVI